MRTIKAAVKAVSFGVAAIAVMTAFAIGGLRLADATAHLGGASMQRVVASAHQ